MGRTGMLGLWKVNLHIRQKMYVYVIFSLFISTHIYTRSCVFISTIYNFKTWFSIGSVSMYRIKYLLNSVLVLIFRFYNLIYMLTVYFGSINSTYFKVN